MTSLLARSRRRRTARPRRGFTIIELMVAIVIISIGLLALAAGSGATVQEMELARHRTATSLIVQARLEKLRASYFCTSFASGTTTVAPAYAEKWTVSAYSGSRTKEVADTVAYKDRKGKTKRFGIVAVLPCH